MKKFEIRFYYNTDLRHSEVVEAVNELEALKELNPNPQWITYSGFRIEIRLYEK